MFIAEAQDFTGHIKGGIYLDAHQHKPDQDLVGTMPTATTTLVKIPLLLVAAYSNFITFTPPNPRSAPDEQGKYSTVKYIVRQVRPPWVRALEKVQPSTMTAQTCQADRPLRRLSHKASSSLKSSLYSPHASPRTSPTACSLC